MDRRTDLKRKAAVVALLFGALLACSSRRAEHDAPPPPVLVESWKAYARAFIQDDGRVVDRRAGGISTSEGQAYAMLRAVWMDDREMFEKTRRWAVENLNAGIRKDHLWAWKWGKAPDGTWRVLDPAFASDADEDAALALILASRRWNEPRYLADARGILADLWQLGTVRAGGQRYLLAGDSLCKGARCRVNPSYCAPYAYRVFAQADPRRNWNELVASSYSFLDGASRLTGTGLPPDWLELDTKTGELRLSGPKDSSFSYDALRTFWRVALDHQLFREPRAAAYLKTSLKWIDGEWRQNRKVAAVISKTGRAEAAYESYEMVAALMPGLRLNHANTAAALREKLQATYSRGFWADRESYYLQNWAWFGTALWEGYLPAEFRPNVERAFLPAMPAFEPAFLTLTIAPRKRLSCSVSRSECRASTSLVATQRLPAQQVLPFVIANVSMGF